MIPVKKYKNINITLWRIPEKNIEPLKILNDKLNPLYFSNLESKIKTYYKKYPLKPHGLWYSCGVSWYNFCLDNEFGDWCVYKDCNVYQLEIDKSKILFIIVFSTSGIIFTSSTDIPHLELSQCAINATFRS